MTTGPVIARFPVTRLRDGTHSTCNDVLVVEEPLEIRIEGRRYTATMRTPGHDDLLARGLLFCEGVIEDNDDIEKLTQSTLCRERSEELVNLVDVTLHDSASIPAHLWERSLISNSSCGLCGKSNVEAMTAQVGALPESGALPQEVLWSLNGQMRERQALFQQTGGLHAAGIFSARGECLALFEDIGRHNATDKAIGFGLLNDWLPWNQTEPAVLFVSGRASFEIVQKALRARLPIVASVSAASSLAVDLAVAHNLTLLGFLREHGCTIYGGAQRITAGE
jgi:FdhD protein